MTAAILAFRATPEAASRLAVVEALDASRAIIRNRANHAPDDLRLACQTVMSFSDDDEEKARAYLLLRAMDAPKPANPRAWTIRGELPGIAGMGVVCAACFLLLMM